MRVPVLAAAHIAQKVVLVVVRIGEVPAALEGPHVLEVVHCSPAVAWYASSSILGTIRRRHS